MFKVVMRNLQARKDGLEPLYIRLSHNRKVRYIKTEIKLHSVNWDNLTSKVVKHPNANSINLRLQRRIIDYQLRLMDIDTNGMDINDLVKLLRNQSNVNNFFEFYDSEFRPTINSKRTKELYDHTINKIKQYEKSNYLDFKIINIRFLSGFEYFLKARENKTNTIAIDLRNIRAIYNRAILLRIVDRSLYPFDNYKVKKENTPKRNLSLEKLKLILNYKGNKHIEYACSVFILMFCLRGINAIDIYQLSDKNIVDGYIRYVRQKTGKELYIKIEPQIKNLMSDLRGEKKLFSFQEKYANHSNFYKNINKQINKIEGFDKVTTYWSRHSWATIAAKIGISKDIIAFGLSHGRDSVTDVYIEPSQELVDEAARKVILLVVG